MKDFQPICFLRPDLLSFSVVGVILNLKQPRRVDVNRSSRSGMTRWVFNFTLRDERGDTINVSVWGKIDYVCNLFAMCYIGAFVQVVNPRVNVIKDDKNLDYVPHTSSQYYLVMDEQRASNLALHDGIDSESDSLKARLEEAFHMPIKSDDFTDNKVVIRDLLRDHSYFPPNTIVSLTAIVVAIGPVMEFTNKNNGKYSRRQEVKFMDSSIRDRWIGLVLWDSVEQQFAQTWKPRISVVHMGGVKLFVDSYTNRKYLTTTPRTVLTVDPRIPEGHQLARFAAHSLPDDVQLAGVIGQHQAPTAFIRDKAKKLKSVANLCVFAQRLSEGYAQGLFRGLVCHFPLDSDRVLHATCEECGRRLGRYNETEGVAMCESQHCRDKNASFSLHFDVPVTVVDSTGLTKLLHLKDDVAEKVLHIKAEEFMAMRLEDRNNLRDTFWMEWYEIGVQVEIRSTGVQVLTILHMEQMNIAHDC